MTITAIDPGTTESAFVEWNGHRVISFGIVENEILLKRLEHCSVYEMRHLVFIEMIASYGMPVGKETFETVLWIGQFVHACKISSFQNFLVYRKDVKMHLCHSMKAKDGNIRQAIIDRFGGKELAIGTKKNPGVLYGISSHLWAALAVAVYSYDNLQKGQQC